MKGKILIISLLAVLLVYIVYRMMVYESLLRQEKNVSLYVEDESKPLVEKINYEALKEIAENSDYYFRADGEYIRRLDKPVSSGDSQLSWKNMFMKGVNLGVAVPGHFPAEFSLSFEEYVEWLKLIGEMNANIVRTYTILPPAFYEAFAWYNLHYHDKPLYLMQGVWTEVPKSENYYETSYMRSFQKEIIDVIDVIHGRAVLRERPGKAAGVYATDISKYVVAILLGREWEPSSVHKTNQVNSQKQYTGDFISMNDGNAMEAWLAAMLDFAVLYETQSYHFQHPVSFVNWLPLDPMYHSTEIIETKKVREYDNDLESIDFSRFHSTSLFVPGIFAAYHAYPYYPDFIYLQDTYADSASFDISKNSYQYYLKDLKNHTKGMPLVIAEYGLPSSRGNSHYSPFGYHQGGHTEAEQAAMSLALTRDIVKSGCAGAIYFEWIDEWFKHNWLVEDFELPGEDRKNWHNMENPEQNFGIMAMEDKIKRIDGELGDWETNAGDRNSIQLLTDADASYFYIALIIDGFDFSRNNLYLAIDTYDEEKGDHKLPFSEEVFDNGFEFLAAFKSPADAAILVDEPYSVFTDIYKGHIPVIASQNNNNGEFIRQQMLTNRGRVSLTGKVSGEVIIDRSKLVHGQSLRPSQSNADWYFNGAKDIVEIRLDWHLLNVSDPVKHFVLDDKPGTPELEITKTDAFRLIAFVTDKNDRLLARYPEGEALSYLWPEWATPRYTQRLKTLYYTLQDYFRQDFHKVMEAVTVNKGDETFSIAEFYNDKPGAISIQFSEASSSLNHYGLPILEKYRIRAGKKLKDTQGIPFGEFEPTLRIRSMDSLLRQRKQQWTVFAYKYMYGKTRELPMLGRGENTREIYILQSDFEKHIRLFRNTDYWIATEDSVFSYLMEKMSSQVQTERFKNVIYLKVTNRLDPSVYRHPLTILYRTGVRNVRISGSESDGFYNNRNGMIRFNVMPGKEVSLEILE